MSGSIERRQGQNNIFNFQDIANLGARQSKIGAANQSLSHNLFTPKQPILVNKPANVQFMVP